MSHKRQRIIHSNSRDIERYFNIWPLTLGVYLPTDLAHSPMPSDMHLHKQTKKSWLCSLSVWFLCTQDIWVQAESCCTARKNKQADQTEIPYSTVIQSNSSPPNKRGDYVIKTRGLKPQYDNCPGNAQHSDWNALPARGSMAVLFVSVCTKIWGWLSWSSLILMWFSLWLEQQVVVRVTLSTHLIRWWGVSLDKGAVREE